MRVILSTFVLMLVSQSTFAACMLNLSAVVENEKKNPSCKSEIIEHIWEKYGDQTLQGEGMASSYRIRFLDPNESFSLVYNGEKIKGSICCQQGRWQMQNSQGVQSLVVDSKGLKISGYYFRPAGKLSGSSQASNGGSSGGWQSMIPGASSYKGAR